jgi:hypothetical protein
MRLKPKFCDLTLDDVQWGPGGPAPINSEVGVWSGKKKFAVMPRIDGNNFDPYYIPESGMAATRGYLAAKEALVQGYGNLLILTLSQEDVWNGRVELAPPVAPGLLGSVVASISGGPELAPGIDFEVSHNGTALSWEGYGIENRVRVGDVLRIIYKARREGEA